MGEAQNAEYWEPSPDRRKAIDPNKMLGEPINFNEVFGIFVIIANFAI